MTQRKDKGNMERTPPSG